MMQKIFQILNFKSFAWLIFAGILLFGSVALAEPIAKVNIHLAEGAKKTSVAETSKVIPIKPGDQFTPENVDKAVDFLRKWGVFETINVGTESSKDGAILTFYLKEATLIGRIDVSGNYPYIQQKIKKYLTIRVGDIYLHGRIQEQVDRIKDFYEREGFANTEVTASETWDEKNADVNILFKIKRGSLFRYGDVKISGIKNFSKGRIVSAINPLRPYKPKLFNEAVRNLQEFYRFHGFPKARIEVSKKEFDFDKHRVNVEIRVSEGPRVEVSFVGNERLPSRKLKKALTIFEEGSFEEYEIETSIEALLKLYRKNGFPEAKISHTYKTFKSGLTLIQFLITEGPKENIKKIEIEGNLSISGKRIKKQMATKPTSLTDRGMYDEKLLNDDLASIKNLYGANGFPNAKVAAPVITSEKGGFKIVIPIEENEQVLLEDIVFSGNKSFAKSSLPKKLKNQAGKPFDPTAIEDDRQKLLNFYADNGYPYAEVAYSTQMPTTNRAVIKFEITEGPLVKIGQILVIGNSITSAKAIKKSIPLRERQPFNYQKILECQSALRRLGAFNSVNIETIGLEEREKIVHIRIKVEEQKPFVMDFEAGFSTDISFTGAANFTNLNTFGLAKRSGLKLIGGKVLSRAEAFWTDPRFVGSDFELTIAPWFQYESRLVYTYLQAGGGFGFFRKYHRTGISARYDLMRNYFVKGDSNAADADSLRDSTISKISLSANFDTRNSFSDPTKGIFAIMTTDFYNELRGRKSDFTKLRWGFGHFIEFLKYLSLSNNLRLGMLQDLGSAVSIPSNELFLMGGGDTIRGFREDSLGPVNADGQPTGGRVRWIYNGELRLKVYKNWKVAGFFDIGALVNDFSEISLDSTRQSAGFGLRYMTPVGPIRLDYGIIVDPKPGDSFGRLHFTFGYVF